MTENVLVIVEIALVIAGVHLSRRITQDIDPGYTGSMGVFTLRGSRLLREHEEKYPNSSKRTVLLILVAAFLLLPPVAAITALTLF